MVDEKRALKELNDLDKEITSLSKQQTSDNCVSFDYEITPTGSRELWKASLFLKSIKNFDSKKISKVIYILHPTFKPNKIAVSNSATNFKLDIMAWGDFHAMAIIVYKDGKISQLVQWLPIGASGEEIAS